MVDQHNENGNDRSTTSITQSNSKYARKKTKKNKWKFQDLQTEALNGRVEMGSCELENTEKLENAGGATSNQI